MAHHWNTAGRFPRRITAALAAALIGAFVTADANAAAKSLVEVKKQEWTFAGIFGRYDQAQLQRGYQVYREACSVCHSMRLVPFRALTDEDGPNMPEDVVKQIASEYRVTEISNETGQPFERPATLTDLYPSPYPNDIVAAQANGGAVPPDFSLIAKARAVKRGFPNFVVDAFANYAENGPDYLYALLTGYTEPPVGEDTVPSKWYNPVFLAGPWISMPPPLRDGQVSYQDGAPETLEQYSADISAFLMWAAEPKLQERKEIGFRVMVFLLVLSVLLYLTKRKLWRNVDH